MAENKPKANAQAAKQPDPQPQKDQDKGQALILALTQQQKELDIKAKSLADKEQDLLGTFADVSAQKRKLETLQAQAKNGFAKQLDEQFKVVKQGLDERDADLVKQTQNQQKQSEQLKKREVAVSSAEQKRDEGFGEQQQAFEQTLIDKARQAEQALVELRHQRHNALEKDIEEERQERQDTLNQTFDQQRAQFEQKHQTLLDELEHKNNRLKEREAELDTQADENRYTATLQKSRQASLNDRQNDISIEVGRATAQREKSFLSQEASLKAECERLREAITTSETTLSLYAHLQRCLGGETPEAVLRKLNALTEHNNQLKEELINRPSTEMLQLFDDMKDKNEQLDARAGRLSEENKMLIFDAGQQEQLQMEKDILDSKNQSLQYQVDSIDTDNNRLRADLKRLQSSYEREQDREVRIRDIELPYFKDFLPRADVSEPITEMQWLDGIHQSCVDYGLTFPKRILYAFHTALKTAEWSPLTILSGVSGTGKSELPRLYSHFGGINFLSLAVQPNWDSQESMLGFFNSIDNKFDAQPVLRLLAQSQRPQTSEYPGLNDAVTIVLLDEMNLAHVELYFAEFLSKLELRRGKIKKDVPRLAVKLGAGVDPYDLPLGRNVLWAGTMNQDETTKSLSDKVLDRGIAIHFPRPTKLHRRKKLKALDNPSALLSRKLWSRWLCTESQFEDEIINEYKSFVEQVNEYMSKVGMALGHRVWQSIEYYMANYPEVLQAQQKTDETAFKKSMRIAFEDQLVQKVMPKLRGIETRGSGKTDCLDKIRNLLVKENYAIVEDFDLACKFGYGQFMWNSANYLKEDEPVGKEQQKVIEDKPVEKPSSEPAEKKTPNDTQGVTDEQLQKLKSYCDKNSKQPQQLSEREIIGILNCDADKAKEIVEALSEINTDDANEKG
jgi:hypothetical protein